MMRNKREDIGKGGGSVRSRNELEGNIQLAPDVGRDSQIEAKPFSVCQTESPKLADIELGGKKRGITGSLQSDALDTKI